MIPTTTKTFQSLIFFAIEKIYTDINHDSNCNYIRLCDESAIKLLKSTTKTIGIICVSMSLYIFFPIYMFITSNDIQLPIPVLLPFTDIKSIKGMIMNILNQLFIGLIGIAGNVGIEIITCILKNTVWASTVVICHSIDEFSNITVNFESKESINCHFRNILIQVQDLHRYFQFSNSKKCF